MKRWFFINIEKLKEKKGILFDLGGTLVKYFFGPQKLGMDAIILDRNNTIKNSQENYISNLNDILKHIKMRKNSDILITNSNTKINCVFKGV